MRHEHPAGGIARVEHRLGRLVTIDVLEADEVERPGDRQFQERVCRDKLLELLGKRNVMSHECLQSLDAVVPQYEPELEGPESPAQWNLPVAVVDHVA